MVVDKTARSTDLFNQFSTISKPLVVPTKDNEWLDSFKNDGSDSGMLDILSKLSLAYPACSLCLQKFKLPAKRSFINWFIKDFLVRCMLDV
jgi:hypothetical protein